MQHRGYVFESLVTSEVAALRLDDVEWHAVSVVTLFDGGSVMHSEGRARERRWI